MSHQPWTDEDLSHIESLCAPYPSSQRQSALLPVMLWAQDRQGGWLCSETLEAIAHVLDTPLNHVHSVATFYTMFRLEPVPPVRVEICQGIACCLRGADQLLSQTQEWARDKKEVHVSATECLGACAGACVAKIHENDYENLTLQELHSTIEDQISLHKASSSDA